MATELRLHGLARQGNRSVPARIAIQYRWEIGSGRFVVEADGHQGRLHDESQATVEAALEYFMVSRRKQKAWSGKRPRRTDQRLEALVGLGDCVSKEGGVAGVPGDPTHMLDDPGGIRVDRLAQFTAAIETMNPAAQQIARPDVLFGGRPRLVPLEIWR
jgi:hypothetical protein